MLYEHSLHALDLFGTITFAATGALIAREQRQNPSYAALYAVSSPNAVSTICKVITAATAILAVFLYLPVPLRPTLSSQLHQPSADRVYP